MLLPMRGDHLSQGGIWRRRVLEKFQESIAVAIRQHSGSLLGKLLRRAADARKGANLDFDLTMVGQVDGLHGSEYSVLVNGVNGGSHGFLLLCFLVFVYIPQV
jgi:hypothetical protein